MAKNSMSNFLANIQHCVGPDEVPATL